MSTYRKLNNIIKDKKILYIPIYSCFDYITKELNFKADGNINRFLTTFFFSNGYKSLTILYPPTGNNIDWFTSTCKTLLHDVKLIPSSYIVKSAKIERSLKFANDVFNSFVQIGLEEYDCIIVEAQHLFLKFFNNGYNDKLIYWCPVCATDDKTRDFLEPFKELDRYIFSIAKHTILASDDQVNYYKTITDKEPIQIKKLINRILPCFKYKVQDDVKNLFNKFNNYYKIFLPFRLTDKGYKMQEIFDYLYNEYRGSKSFKVFYTNPNNCDIYQFAKNDSYKKLFIDNNFIQVSKDRDTYYTIIDYGKVIIPYFEDIDFIRHAAIDEFISKYCYVCKNLEEFINILNKQ